MQIGVGFNMVRLSISFGNCIQMAVARITEHKSACYYARNVYLTVCLIGPNGAILAIRVLRVKRQLSRCILRITKSSILVSLSL